MQLLSHTHLQSPAALKPGEMYRYGQFRRAGETQMLHILPPQLSSPNYQIQFPSSSNGGRIAVNGGDLSLATNHQQWQSGPPQLFATAAASSGFPPQMIRPNQQWPQKNGFHSLIRPSWPIQTILLFFFSFQSFFSFLPQPSPPIFHSFSSPTIPCKKKGNQCCVRGCLSSTSQNLLYRDKNKTKEVWGVVLGDMKRKDSLSLGKCGSSVKLTKELNLQLDILASD